MINILIADDHSIVRLGMKQIICSLPGAMLVTEARTFDEAIFLMEAQNFDLMILDINMPGGNNRQMIDAVKLRQPGIRILVFSAYDEILYALNYIQAGADGYIEKNSPDEEFRIAINAVLKGEKYISRAVRDLLIGKFTGQQERSNNPFSVLSPREIEVMNLLTKGLPLIKIAEILHLQLTTVSTYKTRIFEKVGVKNVIALIEKAQMYQVATH
ncbi:MULTISPECIES: response regulator [Chitinophaga]|uniref:response regulator n=1 Tax=Chitinophaga TaxID=79328 RepID=UPI000DBA6928|nr:response regulator transcription factor [Chitinophaga ginsengisegetis]MDR6571129.1 DNA-binding NarL/FixJ family response regulator [Chitinophaga ginsengisegetis]MDR6650863.1 DNA-binding NarL/FixJ family response regulator [Chitinophaga ginsengisegetis]MDR6657250.1 DNA-binding NarL/FixJ family response regulator [Chitinophaga ginsengisegetis]